MATWDDLIAHLQAVPEGVYEGWDARNGYDNHTTWGREFGEDGVPWCVIFDWCMYNDVGLARIVPKVDNVSAFADWARVRGQWSEYPSWGAWVDFGNGAHTEIVVRFDDVHVYTKGGNTIPTGGDAGQGNGVYSHTFRRTDPRVTGYLAPRFPDGCPPTADPHDPRGSAPSSGRPTVALVNVIDSARLDPPAAQGAAAHRTDVLLVEQALQAEGLLASGLVDGSYGTATIRAYAAYQRRLGFSGTDANGIPGQTSLTRLGNQHGFRVR
ncbi:peptidoglycan-binding protein [Embleya sp. NPDC050493]|uniref:peptidoglycan-binding protein n=1 Tax=Embleya sp. NPDC050493 TaxID=3363989 RepID=UPI0037909B8C